MGFPKDTPKARDVAEGQPKTLEQVAGQEFLLKSYTLTDNENYGKQAHLQCEDSEGKGVELITFSGIVQDQLEGIRGALPCLIQVVYSGTYFTIY